jgi:hypothetical protein
MEQRIHKPKPREPVAPVEPDAGPPPLPPLPETQGQPEPHPLPTAPVRGPDPDELAGMRQNTKLPDDVIRVDEEGRQWLQEEVQKPAYPKPRGRRVLRYNDPGTKEVTVQQGEYTETFEIAGDPKNATPSEVKVTLPSYQVGVYRDRRFPFKVITYNGNSGFDRKEVQEYYGGDELVPAECKRKYVENVLCYDMRSVIRQIQTEYRQLQLAGRIQ